MHESCFIGVINGVWRFQDLLASVLQTFSNKDLYLVMTDVAASAVVFVGETAPSGTVVHFTNYTLPATSHSQHQQGMVLPAAPKLNCSHVL